MIVHLNGRLIPAEQAAVSPFDRGFIFGDGVYEGMRSFAGRIHSPERHVRRMEAGLGESRIGWDPARLEEMCEELVEANNLPDAFIYWQVTRGTPRQGQPVRTRIPSGPMDATVFGYCIPQPALEKFEKEGPASVHCSVREDTRWTRGHLKSISLLGNVMAAIESTDAGAQDAILVREGLVGEGTCANLILAVPAAGGRTEVVTPSLDSVPILGGVTRAVLLEECRDIVARPVRIEELFRASELMLCGTTAMVTSVTKLDGRPVGGGEAGPVARRLLKSLTGFVRKELERGPTAGTIGVGDGKRVRTAV